MFAATALCILVDAPFSTIQKILVPGKDLNRKKWGTSYTYFRAPNETYGYIFLQKSEFIVDATNKNCIAKLITLQIPGLQRNLHRSVKKYKNPKYK